MKKLRSNPPGKVPEQLLTVQEIAVLDNCCEKTVRRAIQAGLLEAVRIGPAGRLIRVPRATHAAYRSRRGG